MLAAKVVEEGRIRAATSNKRADFARALWRLANPRLETGAFLSNSKLVLEGMGGTELMSGLFDELPPFEGFVFVFALRSCLADDLSERTEIVRIAKTICRRVVVARGPKLNYASASHEYFLESQSIFRPAAFTWSSTEEDFNDRLTKATRDEFDDQDFSPVSARRRLRAKHR